jgi:hypothetical protein
VQKWGSLAQVVLFVEVVTDRVAEVRAKACMFAKIINVYVQVARMLRLSLANVTALLYSLD